MQNTHTLSERIPADKHDLDILKDIINICTPIMFSGNRRRNAAQNFPLVKALSYKHKPGVLRIEFRFTQWKKA